MLNTEVSDGSAADEFHHEVRPARVGRAAVKYLRNVGMIHQRQRLPLGLKPSHHLAGIHARLDDLQRHLAANRLLLLGHEHDAEAAFANLFQQFVRTDEHARPFADRRSRRRHRGRAGVV